MKDFINKIKEISKNPRGKALLFFAFYIVFFGGVILFINLSKTSLTYGDDYEKSYSSYSFNIDKLFAANYSFKYSVTLDNNSYLYSGVKNDELELFKYNGLDYFRNKDIYLVKNDTWVRAESPYLYSEYFDIKNIKNILENSYYVSKTVYESGKYTYSFMISSNTLNNILYGLNTDYDEVPNEIIVSTDENKNINNIIFNFNSFGINNGICDYNFKINLEYDLFGEIDNIENPVID